METARNPLWNSVLWFLGALVYAAGVTGLCLFLWVNLLGHYPLHTYLGDLISWGHQILPDGFWRSLFNILAYCLGFSPFGLWVGLLAMGARQVIAHGHKTTGSLLGMLAGCAVVFSVWYVMRLFVVRY